MKLRHLSLSFGNFFRKCHHFKVDSKLILVILKGVQIQYQVILLVLDWSLLFEELLKASREGIMPKIEELLHA